MGIGPSVALAVITALGSGSLADATHADASRWEAPLECPSRAWLDARVDAYLGQPRDRGAEIAFVAVVLPADGRFELELELEAAGLREHHVLRHHDCAMLTEIAASVIAIAIDPLAIGPSPMSPPPEPHALVAASVPIQRPRAHERPAPSPREAPEPAPEPALGPDPDEAGSLDADALFSDLTFTERPLDRVAPSTAERLQLTLAADGGLAIGLFPNLAPSVDAALGALLHPRAGRTALALALVGQAVLAGRFRSADGSSGGDMSAWDLAARACAVPRWSWFELRGCGAVGAGQIRAQGIGVDQALARAHPWVWLRADLGLAFALGRRVALRLDGGPSFALSRPNFSVASPDARYVTPIVSGQARAGVELRFF